MADELCPVVPIGFGRPRVQGLSLLSLDGAQHRNQTHVEVLSGSATRCRITSNDRSRRYWRITSGHGRALRRHTPPCLSSLWKFPAEHLNSYVHQDRIQIHGPGHMDCTTRTSIGVVTSFCFTFGGGPDRYCTVSVSLPGILLCSLLSRPYRFGALLRSNALGSYWILFNDSMHFMIAYRFTFPSYPCSSLLSRLLPDPPTQCGSWLGQVQVRNKHIDYQ